MIERRKSNWQFSHKVMLPVVLAILTTVLAVAGFIVWSTGRTDDHAMARDTALITKAMVDQLAGIPRVQSDLAVWDDALQAVDDHDTDFLDTNLGSGLYESYGYNRAYVLDADLKPVYVMRDGGQVAGKAFEAVRATIVPLITKLRSLDGSAAISAYNSGVNYTVPSATDVMLLEGRPALVSVVPLLSDSGDHAAPTGQEPVYVVAALLDDTLASQVSDQYLLPSAHFGTDATTASGEAAFPLRNKAGDVVAWFKWQPDRPGSRILQDTLPALVGAALVAGAIIALLLRNLQRASNQLQAERADAQHRALHDPLTGLGNRALFRDTLHHAFTSMARGEPRMALLALDLDRFKQVNDSLGHEAGDELLRQVAGRISSLMRPTDTLVRLGGDEFAIVQTAIGDHQEPSTLAQRVIEALKSPFHLDGKSVEIGVSIGIATAPDLAQSEPELASRADDALYRAKAGGRNRYVIYQDETLPHPGATLEHEVREAFSSRRTG